MSLSTPYALPGGTKLRVPDNVNPVPAVVQEIIDALPPRYKLLFSDANQLVIWLNELRGYLDSALDTNGEVKRSALPSLTISSSILQILSPGTADETLADDVDGQAEAVKSILRGFPGYVNDGSVVLASNFTWIAAGTTPTPTPTPVVNAGADATVTVPTGGSVVSSLAGSATQAGGGTIASYLWTKTSGPSGFSFSAATSASTDVTLSAVGTFVFRLTATNNTGGTGYDEVTRIGQAPTAPSLTPLTQQATVKSNLAQTSNNINIVDPAGLGQGLWPHHIASGGTGVFVFTPVGIAGCSFILSSDGTANTGLPSGGANGSVIHGLIQDTNTTLRSVFNGSTNYDGPPMSYASGMVVKVEATGTNIIWSHSTDGGATYNTPYATNPQGSEILYFKFFCNNAAGSGVNNVKYGGNVQTS